MYKFANFQRKGIRKKDFAFTRDGFVVLDSTLIRRFLEYFERKLQSERPYKFKHGRKMKNGMSMCQEATIIKTIIQKLLIFLN